MPNDLTPAVDIPAVWIYYGDVAAQGACEEALEWFARRHPRGTPITRAFLRALAEKEMDWLVWLADKLCPNGDLYLWGEAIPPEARPQEVRGASTTAGTRRATGITLPTCSGMACTGRLNSRPTRGRGACGRPRAAGS